MANRRMFSRDVTTADVFLDMPLSAQALYFHLGLAADDEGFLASPLSILRMVGGCRDDLSLLIAKKFVIPFDSGVCVIRHWRANNYCRSDRFKPTLYTAERAALTIGTDLVYQMNTSGIPSDNQRYTQYSRVEESIDIVGQDCPTPPGDDLSAEADEASSKRKQQREIVAQVVQHLNKKTGAKFSPATKTTERLISGRLSEGYTVQDFIAVIDRKCTDWLSDAKMCQYLRPDTLFSPSKFESYLHGVQASTPAPGGQKQPERSTQPRWD